MMVVSRRFSTGLHNARNISPGNLVWKGRTEKIEMMALPAMPELQAGRFLCSDEEE